MNFSGGGVCESTSRFHTASSASNRPASKPTRGSGVGTIASVSGATSGALIVTIAVS